MGREDDQDDDGEGEAARQVRRGSEAPPRGADGMQVCSGDRRSLAPSLRECRDTISDQTHGTLPILSLAPRETLPNEPRANREPRRRSAV